MKKELLALILLFTGINVFSQELPYTNCNNCWNPDSLGNHRVVISFSDSGKFAKAIIPWRRRDKDPQNKRIILEDAQKHKKILNVKSNTLNREFGEIYFEPVSGAGNYYVYYLPYKNERRSNYPKGVYLKPDTTASSEWISALNENKNIPAATVKEFQSIDAFNSFYPMEVIATKDETNQLIEKNKSQAFLIFPEDRLHSMRMNNDLPQRWIDRKPENLFLDTAMKGENFSYQLGVYALHNINNIKVSFSDLKNAGDEVISAKHMSCLNTSGINYEGKSIHPVVRIEKGKVQALWCLVDISENASAGKYNGKVIIYTGNESSGKEINIELVVKNAVAKGNNVNEPGKMTRLKWLNSALAQDNTVIAPYTPLKVEGNTISLLGRKVELNKDGFPKTDSNFFSPYFN